MRRTTLAALGLLLLTVAAAPAGARYGAPRIVNGIPAVRYPTAGVLVEGSGIGRDRLLLRCSGVLIGCRTFLVAGHCVCRNGALDIEECLAFGLEDPSDLAVYLPHAGFFDVARIALHPEFEYEVVGDVAVLELADRVSGITPSPLNRSASPVAGTPGSIAGFGTTRDSSFDSGLMRVGDVVTAPCPAQVPGSTHVCWSFDAPLGEPGSNSNTCFGDSGGPLFIETAFGLTLAGITSGGGPTCNVDSESWDTDIFAHLSFIDAEGGDDLANLACGDLPRVGEAGVETFSEVSSFDANAVPARYTVDVPAGARALRVALNGEENTSFRPPMRSDFDLFVRAGEPPQRDGPADCADTRAGVYGYCEITDPEPGTWHIMVTVVEGPGRFQLTVTTFVASDVCDGDCDGDGAVTVDEILRGVAIALGELEAAACPSFDADAGGEVTVDEILRAVDRALNGCD